MNLMNLIKRGPRYLKRRLHAATATSVEPCPLRETATPSVYSQKPNAASDGGLFDMFDTGWFNLRKGELFPGFPINSVDTVIDVGCGLGGASRFAAARGAEVIAVDISAEAIRITKEAMQSVATRPIHGYVSDSNPLPVADATADKIIALEMLEHVDDPKQVLSELVRVGKPGAVYLLAVPDAVSESVQRHLAPPTYWEKPNHVRVFEREAFQALVSDSGLVIEKVSKYGFFFAMWWTFFWACDQQLGDPEHVLLASWTKTWRTLMNLRQGLSIKNALEEIMPKSQVVIARKPA